MNTIQIAGVDRPITQLVMGADWFNPDNADRAYPLLDAFVDRGGNAIDTAQVYGLGKSEQVIGQWLAAGNGDEVALITKGAHPIKDSGPRVRPECIDEDLAGSLERLGVETVDIYLLHRDDPDVEVGPIVECLHGHREAGRIRAYGGSNWSIERIEAANEYAEHHDLTPFVVNSPNLTLAVANEEMWKGCISLDPDGRGWHAATQMPVLSWSSQARGFFSGRFSPSVSHENPDVERVYFNDTNWARLDKCRLLAQKHGVEPIQIALAWVLHQPFPVAALVGPQTVEEIDSCVAATEIHMTEDELVALEVEL
jgi:aryl-alcohol dehydrogenase-like predicted oxidoreductase